MKSGKIEIGRKVVLEFNQLIQDIDATLQPGEIQNIKKAFNLIYEKDYHSLTATGLPYVFHSIAIARIAIQKISLGANSAICALLFPYVDAGLLTLEEVEHHFDSQLMKMVESLKKISDIKTKEASDQVENFRKLLLSLATDVRVILIKIAERLYVMQSMDKLDKNLQLRVASEAFYLYAPLGHRLGLYNIKSELEDIALKYTNPDKYLHITKKLKETAAKRNKFIADFIKPIKDKLEQEGFKFEIKGRPKSIYSIWNKMKKQNVVFEEVYDIFAIRVIIDTPEKKEKSDCWRVYSLIADEYQPNPKRLRDWISVPKSNGYESLHTTVIGPDGKWVEVQIRSARMDEIAEKGVAAHWKYKGIKGEDGIDEWIAKVREILETPEPNAIEFVDDFKLSLYNKEIFVFTPRGDLKRFPAGATVLDFAFDIHTDIGCSCVGARVNGKNVPIRHVMQTGDKVEVITAKNQKPKQDWLEFVTTSKAKSKIKLQLKEEVFRESENGKEIFKRRLKNWKIPFNDQNVNLIQRHYKLKTAVDLYTLIFREKIDMIEIKNVLSTSLEPDQPKETEKIEEDSLASIVEKNVDKSSDYLVIDKKINNVDYKLAKCCNPIFGDKIFGFVTINDGIKIHRTSCPNAPRMISKHGYRVVQARWTDSKGTPRYETTIRITGTDDLGIVNKITDVISKDLKVSMRSIAVDSNDGMFEGKIVVYVKDTAHLKNLVEKLGRLKGILSASRMEG
jgi:GTP pyrophosphokinase